MGRWYYLYTYWWRLVLYRKREGFMPEKDLNMLFQAILIRISPYLCLKWLHSVKNLRIIWFFYSDCGVQYASAGYREALAEYNITQSMSRKGDPYDNAVSEIFFNCLKCELIYHKHYKTRSEATGWYIFVHWSILQYGLPQAVFIISYDNYSFIMQILHYVKYPKQFYQANHIVLFCDNSYVAAEYKVYFE